ncbi:MAG: hypothetical protein ACK55Z_16405, partial [bacterium]
MWYLARVLDSILYSCSLDTADSWAVPTFTNLLTCPYTCGILPSSWTACCTAAPWTQLTAGRCPPMQIGSPALILVVSGPRLVVVVVVGLHPMTQV